MVVDLGDRVDRLEDRAADRRPAAGRQALDDVEQHLLVGRRRLDDLGEPGERDDADLGRRVLPVDERGGGRRLGGEQAVRRDVGRAHAARHVHRQDHGRPAGGTRRSTGRAMRHDEAAEPEQEQRERQVAPDPRRPRARPRGPATGSSSGRRPSPRRSAQTTTTGRGRISNGSSSRKRRPQERPSWHPPEPAQRGGRRPSAGASPAPAKERRDLDRLGPDDEPCPMSS